MMQNAPSGTPGPLQNDDIDDRTVFETGLSELPMPTVLETVEDGEGLMTYRSQNSSNFPDVLFLDLNMPRKKGSECLSEIKGNAKMTRLPVIMYLLLYTMISLIIYTIKE